MGGYNSGRYGGRPTVEQGLTLTLSRLLADGQPGKSWSGSLFWTSDGERIAEIGYQAQLGEERGRVRLRYSSTNHWTGEKHELDYWIDLVTTPQPFGGRRWWFVCPKKGGLATKLHKPPGAATFASRKAYRLGYQSQRETPSDRAISQVFKQRLRIGDTGGIGGHITKPKGMRWATFERKLTKIQATECVANGHARAFIQKLERGR